jgi:hypothetical protein
MLPGQSWSRGRCDARVVEGDDVDATGGVSESFRGLEWSYFIVSLQVSPRICTFAMISVRTVRNICGGFA